VHDWYEGLSDLWQLKGGVSEDVKVLLQGLEVLRVLVSLKAGNLHLFLEFAEGTSLS
jgi:hypothetical protein